MAKTSARSPFRLWAAASTASLLLACNAVLGMEELSRAPDAAAGGAGGQASKAGEANKAGDSSKAGEASKAGEGGNAGDGGIVGGQSGSGGSPQVCMPDSRECVNGRALQCNADGSDYESDVPCSSEQTCVAGACEDHQCEPGASFCSGSDVRQCAANGLSSSVTETCAMTEYCDTASTKCEVGVCAPNQPACDGDVATTCNGSGNGYEPGGMLCGSGTTCQSGTCETQVCAPDTVACQGKQLKQCAPNGLSSTVVETCSSSEYCTPQNGGSCKPQVCVPGTKTCAGNTSKKCNATGSATTDTVCSAGFCDSSSGECRTPADLVGALDGRLLQLPCTETPNTDDCSVRAVVDGVSTPCTNLKLEVIVSHPIGGTPGVEYPVTIHFYGIVEPRNYGPNVVRESGSTRPANLNGGATPAPWATAAPGATYTATNYSSYELQVLDQNMTEKARYFVNSDTQEGHYTYVLNFSRPIKVIGGGVVRLKYYDDNCRIIKNCSGGGTPCATKARSVDVSEAIPAPMLSQPGLGSTPEHAGQWLLLDVTAVQ